MSYPVLVPGPLVKPQVRGLNFHWLRVVEDPRPAHHPRRIIELQRTEPHRADRGDHFRGHERRQFDLDDRAHDATTSRTLSQRPSSTIASEPSATEKAFADALKDKGQAPPASRAEQAPRPRTSAPGRTTRQ